MQLSEVRGQSLGTLVVGALVCPACALVDYEYDRMRVGSPCPACQAPSPGGQSYFPFPMHALVDLMQEVFHLKRVDEFSEGGDEEPATAANHRLAVVVYYSSLSELLLEHTLRELMTAQDIRRPVQTQMLRDHPFAKARSEKLFPALTDVKWKQAIRRVSKALNAPFEDVVSFTINVVDARNAFLHQGNHWDVPETLPRRCIDNSAALANLHIALHNEFVRPLYVQTGRRYG